MELKLSIVGYEPKESESYFIEYWYNRHTRDWVVQVFDNFNREQESMYCPDKTIRDGDILYLASKYKTSDIRKV